MAGVTRVNDLTIGVGSHGGKCCPHTLTGIVIIGSPDVFSNNLGEGRIGDITSHNCIAEGTMIPLANGTTVSIESLTNKKEFYVYSFNTVTKRIEIGRGHHCRFVKMDECVEIMLDNNKSFTCTLDHPILMRDGSYTLAEYININDSLMPLYRRKSNYFLIDYEKVKQICGYPGRWTFTHTLADNYNIRNGIYCKESGEIRHHKDFNKLNNNPDNIIRKSNSEHAAIHSNSYWQNDTYRKAIAIKMRKIMLEKAVKGLHPMQNPLVAKKTRNANISNGTFIASSKRMKILNDNPTEGMLFGRKNWMEKGWLSMKNHSDSARRVWAAASKSMLDPTGKICDRCGRKEFKNNASYAGHRSNCNNHKVVKINRCGIIPVYDITVDEFHNFALDCGIFVSNCPHCPIGILLTGSSDVYANGIPFSRLGDQVNEVCGSGTVITASSDVFANG